MFFLFYHILAVEKCHYILCFKIYSGLLVVELFELLTFMMFAVIYISQIVKCSDSKMC